MLLVNIPITIETMILNQPPVSIDYECSISSGCLFHREVEDELEIVWQSANSENDRMKTVLKKTMKKLRQHEQLSEAMDQQEPKKIVYVSSDGEAD